MLRWRLRWVGQTGFVLMLAIRKFSYYIIKSVSLLFFELDKARLLMG